jgi:hypothetical protein
MRCEGYRRYGGVFTLGTPHWEQCGNDASVLLTVEQDGKVSEDLPMCDVCWEEGRQAKINIIEAKPLL